MNIHSPYLENYVEKHLLGERPHIRGRRIPVAQIARRMKLNNWTVAETAYDFSLSEAEVLAALLYYTENQSDIDAQEAEEQAKFDEMKRLYGRD